ncbi:MAG: tetratricopeptide repeat protein [Anaerolineae bacterium]|jgi:tetratricopeptide (TPR) repeat protein|nr:tetratricopeptide repeat protein [Anaerolineae bacterium]MBT7072717.1 tetratricopeptide repeat protein [Anaerolineae bacterium]MBT7324672.1 tetratricopeptide repeat protein [Anaerolineae bacterium]
MANKRDSVQHSFFEQELERIFDALSLATKWQSPAIFFAIYETAASGAEAVSALESRLNKRGQHITHIAPDIDGKNNLAEEVFGKSAWNETVFFMMHLTFSTDADLYETISAHSDFLINNRVRIVYWITQEDFIDYVAKAPADWDIQHKLFDFSEEIPWRSIWSRIAKKAWASVKDQTRYADDYFTETPAKDILSLDILDDPKSLLKRSQILVNLALFYFRQKNFKKAALLASQAIEVAQLIGDKTFTAEAQIAHALIQADLNQEDNDFDLRQELTGIYFRKSTAWNNLGHLYSVLFLFDDSLAAYQNALEIDRENALSWCGAAEAFLELNHLEKAIDAFQKAISYRQNSSRAWKGLGKAYSITGNQPKSVECYMKSVEIDPYQRDIWVEISQLGSKGVALKAIKCALDLDAKQALGWNLLGNIQYHEKNFSEAIRSYYRAIDLDKTFGWAYANMALIYAQLNQHNKAVVLFIKSIQIFRNDADKAHAYYRLGDTYRASGKFTSSVRAYREAEKIFKNRTLLERNRSVPGPILFDDPSIQKKDKTANAPIKQAENRDVVEAIVPKKPVAVVKNKTSISRSRMLRKVLETNKQARNTEYWLELGAFYIRNHMYDLAEDAFQVAIELEPENGWSYYKLGIAYMFTGLYKDAVPLYEKSIQLFEEKKDKALSWNQLGNAYRRLNEHSLAVAAYERARNLEPAKNSMVSRARQSLLSNCYT